MTSSRPYLIRALYEWIVDNDMTPHLLVDVGAPEVQVPLEYVEEGKIVLNVSPASVRELELGDEYIMFSARFSGRAMEIVVPVSAVDAIYARENGQGMAFPDEPEGDGPPEPPGDTGGRPALKLVK